MLHGESINLPHQADPYTASSNLGVAIKSPFFVKGDDLVIENVFFVYRCERAAGNFRFFLQVF